MIEPPRLGQRGAQVLRSQLAMEVAVTTYALVGTLIILRLVLILLGVSNRVWTGEVVFSVTDAMLAPLVLVPGGNRLVVAQLTLADLTAVSLLALVPMALFAISRKG